MKKIYAIVAAVAALSFTACGNKTQNTAECDSTCNEACICDPCECDPCQCGDECGKECCEQTEFCGKALTEAIEAKDATTFQQKVEEAKAFIAKLIKEGKTEEAAKYTEQLKQFIVENKAKIEEFTAGNATISNLVDNVTNLPTDVATLATSLGVQAKDAAVDAQQAVENAAANAVAAGQQKVEEGKAAAQQKANEAVEAGKQKANDAIDNAANEMKRGLGL